VTGQAYFAECLALGEPEGAGLRIGVTLSDAPAGTVFDPTMVLPCLLGDRCPTGGHHELRAVSAGELARLMRDEDESRCCDLHGRNCEPPSEICCDQCTEMAHPMHGDGTQCSNPDLSAAAVDRWIEEHDGSRRTAYSRERGVL